MTTSSHAAQRTDYDMIVVGAGLASALLVLRLGQLPEPPDVLVVEAAPQSFGDKTWSLQQTDITPADRTWLESAFVALWPRQSVRFRDLSRELPTGYASINSASLRNAVGALPGVTVRTGAPVAELAPDAITLESGESLTAPCVIDARGHDRDAAMALAYQKFVGRTIETETPHGVEVPVIMDASVPQIDGYRFVYLLPFSDTRILIEDTRYSDTGDLDDIGIDACIDAYAAERGWRIRQTVHRETGVLPITLAFDRRRFWAGAGEVPRLGMRAALFHSTTGYSLPDAVRTANLVAEAWPVDSRTLAPMIRKHAARRAPVQAFYRFLNRMLFKAAPPERRHLVMQKFYTLPNETIERFYAGRTSLRDIARILSGRPPVPIHRALRCIAEPRIRRSAR